MKERLQKIFSNIGLMSRRAADEMIAEGRVTVNGQVALPGTKADFLKDHIKIDGKLLNPSKEHRFLYIKFYKPIRVVTTLEDPEGRQTIQDFIKDVGARVYPVGRLDFNSEGLLLLTNDGDFANNVLHPKNKIPKTYHVKVRGVFSDNQFEKLQSGVHLEDGITQPSKCRRLKMSDVNSWMEIVLFEGKKRQIRRMCQRLGHPVLKLKRISIGGVTLGLLTPGQWEPLTKQEFKSLSINFTQVQEA